MPLRAETATTVFLPEPPVSYGRWIGLGLFIEVVAVVLFWLPESGSFEFWPGAVAKAGFIIVPSLVFLVPCYLVYAGVAVRVVKRTRLSEMARRRWLLGPPVLALVAAALNLLNDQRPSVGFESATGQSAPASLRKFRYAHGGHLMSVRKIASFEIAPADLQRLVQEKELSSTNGMSLARLLNDDREFTGAGIPNWVPEVDFSVCYLHLWQELNFSTRRYLFTTVEHDKAVWVYMHHR
jgi:hypothetical protein